MARQIVNIGSSANQGDGDPLRVAFDKINDNFDELYARDINTDSQTTVYAVDSTLLVDGETGSIVLDGTVKGNIVPDTDVAYDLGSASKRFRDLYLSGSTIDLGGTTLSVVGGELQLGGVKVITQSELDVAVQNDITTNLTGSVFADDSTLLVDSVAGKIVGIIENTAITTNTITGNSNLTLVGANGDTDGGTVVVVGGIGNGGDGGDITLAAGIGQAGVGGEVTLAGGIGSTDGGEITITGGIGSTSGGGPVSIRGGSGGTDGGNVTIYAGVGGSGNGVINIGTFNTSAVNIDNAVITGDLTGSVFADDSTVLVDGVNGSIPWSVISDVDLDALVAGEGIPDLLTAYTEASLAVDSLLNAGDYGGDLVAPSDYTFYDLVVARRAIDPLIPQELEQAALAQLNAYNAWQAEIAADKATITVGDYTWDFKGDGNIDGLFEGTGPVSFNNDYYEDGFRGGFTTDKSILQINGAEYLNGSDDGGGIYIAGGTARNGGNNGDVIIASGVGGADGTGIISLLSSYISAAGTWIGTQTMDIKGSVFGDDSTLLVDGVAGKLVGPYDNGVVSINPTNVTTYDLFVQQDANTHDLYVANRIYGGETGARTTLVIGSDVDFNDTVKFAKTTTTGDDDNPTLTLIDVNSSSVQVLTSNSTSTNNWELPDGSEGQIMHFVASGAGGAGANHKIKINNWWKRDSETGTWSSVTGYWDVFTIYGFSGSADTGMATAIFVDGAWRTSSPWVD